MDEDKNIVQKKKKKKKKKIVQASWPEGLAVGKTGSCSGEQDHVQ